MQSINAAQLPYGQCMFYVLSLLVLKKLGCADSLPVGKWVKDEFGAESSVTAVFMTHAVVNGHTSASNSSHPLLY